MSGLSFISLKQLCGLLAAGALGAGATVGAQKATAPKPKPAVHRSAEAPKARPAARPALAAAPSGPTVGAGTGAEPLKEAAVPCPPAADWGTVTAAAADGGLTPLTTAASPPSDTAI